MSIFMVGVLAIICIIALYFNSSISKEQSEFKHMVNEIEKEKGSFQGVFTESDIKDLPSPVQKYFRNCGFIGAPKMSYMNARYEDVEFSQGKDGKKLTIDYNQYNSIKNPYRVAYIDSSLFGIPFEGLEYIYKNETPRMKGVVGKFFKIFDVTGPQMNQSALSTYLAECLIVPNAALQEFIKWEEIDNLSCKATISYNGTTAAGIFRFNQNGEMISFTTDDRWVDSTNGTYEKRNWSAICSDYKENNGLIQPTRFKAVWHYDDGDFIYFDSDNMTIEFN